MRNLWQDLPCFEHSHMARTKSARRQGDEGEEKSAVFNLWKVAVMQVYLGRPHAHSHGGETLQVSTRFPFPSCARF